MGQTEGSRCWILKRLNRHATALHDTSRHSTTHHTTPQHSTTRHATSRHNTRHHVSPIMEMSKAIPPISAESILLAERLAACKVGETITYDEISKLIGRDSRVHRGCLTTARAKVLRENQMVFHCVRAEGIKLADANEITEGEMTTIGSIHRKANRSLRRLACAAYEKLTNAQRIKHSTTASMLGTMTLFTSSNSLKRVEAAVIGNGQQLPAAKTLALFASTP